MVLSFVCSQNTVAQTSFELLTRALSGEINIEVSHSPVFSDLNNRRMLVMYTEKQLMVLGLGDTGRVHDFLFGYGSPKETKIVSAKFKADYGSVIFILLSNGNIVILRYNSGRWKEGETIKPSANFIGAQKITGDAVYVLKQGKVYASSDTAKTWQIDTTNLGTEYVADVTVDTSYYAWAITQSRNVYYQHPDSNVWHKDTSFSTTGFPQAIFVDRKGRMFVSTTSSADRVWMSTDGGSSWANTSTGITETITSFGDDAFGNIYAVGFGSRAYRLSNLTPPWVSIADSINAQAYLPSTAKIVSSISGDTILYAATRYGMFHSTDFGANWAHSPGLSQLTAHIFYTGVVRAGNYHLLSTNLGIYRVAAGDTTWEKVFPRQGYIWGVNVLSSDSAGNVYSNLPFRIGQNTTVFYNVKSTDGGATWLPDTAGQGTVGITAGTQAMDFSVDRQGTQFLRGNAILYTKEPGQSWKIDTAGLGMKSGEYLSDVSMNNKKGIIYLSRTVSNYPATSLFIYSRATGDSVWRIVNTSLLAAGDGRIMSDHDGNIIVRTLTHPYKIWRYDGNTWTETPLPTTIGSSPLDQILTVDRSGVLWGSFFGGGSNKGVYFSTDNGNIWNYVGLNNVGIIFLSAVEDTVYAVTFIDGIYGFTTASTPTSVHDGRTLLATSYALFQNYPNPFNPTTTFRYALPVASNVQLRIYNLLGQLVATLADGIQDAGYKTADWNAGPVASGVYIYRFEATSVTNPSKSFMQVRKAVLIK